MKLQQLKYLKAIIQSELNVSAASHVLYTSQPGISKQIALLEQELGVKIFNRKGKNLNEVTDIGRKIIEESNRIIDIEEKIRAIVRDHINPESGGLNIYTTNTIARFLLPNTIESFVKKYPNVTFHVGTANPDENGAIIKKGHSDFSIVAQEVERTKDLIVLPAYKWSQSLILPPNHPLCKEKNITLEMIGKYKLISYEDGSTGRISQDEAFKKAGIEPIYFMTVMDTDVIKKYVSMGFGIGIVATIAADNICDDEIVAIPLKSILPYCDAWICYSRSVYLQNYMYDFIESFAPHLTKEIMEGVGRLTSKELFKLKNNFDLPRY